MSGGFVRARGRTHEVATRYRLPAPAAISSSQHTSVASSTQSHKHRQFVEVAALCQNLSQNLVVTTLEAPTWALTKATDANEETESRCCRRYVLHVAGRCIHGHPCCRTSVGKPGDGVTQKEQCEDEKEAAKSAYLSSIARTYALWMMFRTAHS